LSHCRDTRKLVDMRDRETIDAELRRLAAGRQSIREQGRQPSSREADELLDELLAHTSGVPPTTAVTSGGFDFVPDDWSTATKTVTKPRRTVTKPRGRKDVLRRFGLFAALPLSLVAAVAAVVVMTAVHSQDSAEPPADSPPSAAPSKPAAPKPPAPRIDVADMAFVAALNHEGIPVPSQEYVTNQGHAVCEFLAREPNFAAAVGFVQRTTIWNADQSANVIAGAIVSYCPQSQPAVTPDDISPAYQNALTDIQDIDKRLHGVQGDLQNMQGALDGLLGHP
jgi:hypothetical protein